MAPLKKDIDLFCHIACLLVSLTSEHMNLENNITMDIINQLISPTNKVNTL